MRLFAASAVLLFLAGVGHFAYEHWPRTERHYYAVGAMDEVVAPYPCRLQSQTSKAVKVEEWAESRGIRPLVFTALAPGSARFACSDVTYVVEVRLASRLELRAPASVPVGQRFTVTLVGRDADGTELEIGRYPEVAWTFGDSVAADNPRGQCEFPPWCGSPPPGSSWARATAAGVGSVAARLGALGAAATIAVTPAVEAGR